jgi:hypothetical protein
LKAIGRVGLGGRLLAIVLAIVSIDLVINSVLFKSAWHYVIQEDQAAWMRDGRP